MGKEPDSSFTFKYSYRLTESLIVFFRAVLIMITGSEIHRISPVSRALSCSCWAIVRMYYQYYQLRSRMTVWKNPGNEVQCQQEQAGHESNCYKNQHNGVNHNITKSIKRDQYEGVSLSTVTQTWQKLTFLPSSYNQSRDPTFVPAPHWTKAYCHSPHLNIFSPFFFFFFKFKC